MVNAWANQIFANPFLWRSGQTVRMYIVAFLLICAPILIVATYLAVQPISGDSGFLRWVLLADLIYILIVATLVMRRILRIVAERRAQSAGSRLHLRLTAAFATAALVPAVIVAFFAMLTINGALEGWFSDRVKNALTASESAALAYQDEQERGLATDTQLLANVLNFERRNDLTLDDGDIRVLLGQLQPRLQRPIKELFVVNNLGDLRVRGPGSYQFNFERPTTQQLAEAENHLLLITDLGNGEIRSLLRLSAFTNHYLYIGRALDADLVELLNETTQTAQRYRDLEAERGKILFDFGVLYLAFAVILVLAATWGGLLFAERLAGPVGKLTAAAQQVGGGNLDARIQDIRGDDEIAMLGRYFNQMTRQLRGQQDRLIKTNEQTDRQRRLFDSVLSSITSGVIGVGPNRRITFVNRSARRVLLINDEVFAVDLLDVVPEFVPLFDSLRTTVHDVVQGEVKLLRGGAQENLLVRIATRDAGPGTGEGYVIAFEDVTDLVSAQRLAAWGDVARRIAHEIKNPLTPIQLSAERLRRKYAPMLGDEAETLTNLTNVIIRQTGDLRRIVDDFSRFARMPEPERETQDLAAILRDAVLLQETAQPEVQFSVDISAQMPFADVDATLMTQALTNLIKNAAESVIAQAKLTPDRGSEIRIALEDHEDRLLLTIADNGLGLPADRAKLFEPYVTHRDGGTGLGLPIVLKIIEDHGGGLSLKDAPPFGDGQIPGAVAEIILPRASQTQPALDNKRAAE